MYVNDVIYNNTELDKTTHMPAYPDATQWSITMNVKINTVNSLSDTSTGVWPDIMLVTAKTHVFDRNLQKQRILDYKLQERLKQQ